MPLNLLRTFRPALSSYAPNGIMGSVKGAKPSPGACGAAQGREGKKKEEIPAVKLNGGAGFLPPAKLSLGSH